jgi:hypothetical protein
MAITNFPTPDQLRLTPQETAQLAKRWDMNPDSYYPKVDGLPPEVKEMLQEKRKRVYALKMLLKTEEESLRVYERMLGE